MVVAREAHGQIHVVDRLRDRVGLAEGLLPDKSLGPEIAERALVCLRQFGQRIGHMPRHAVRVVGTNTLRQVEDDGRFIEAAESALGHRVEVISGEEEARLIYLGVAHSSPDVEGQQLVVDIGGGSTEIIVGEGFEVLDTASLHMGCVNFSLRHFPDGKISRKRFEEAMVAGLLELRAIKRRFRRRGWDRSIGSSGTIHAVEQILRENGWDDGGGITRLGLLELRRALVRAGSVQSIAIPGTPADRAPVLAGGVAILLAIFDSLQLERMVLSTGALREGVLYDLLGRIHREDVRDRTIRVFLGRYHADAEHARRVEATALALFDGVAGDWALDRIEDRRLLGWAARLHEIGLSVAYSGYHKHGAYLVRHGVMPGFSRDDQLMLAALIGGQRRKVTPAQFHEVPGLRRELGRRLCVLLRLAVRLHRSRSPIPPPPLEVRAGDGKLEVRFPNGWLDEHHLTRASLELEKSRLLGLDFRLDFV